MTRREKKGSGGAAPASRSGGAAQGGRSSQALRFTRSTAMWAGAGVVTAGLGFFLLARENISVSPFLLLAAFLVFFPLALIK